ncbi:MAG TPA: SOS response-associated peptidase [bacterium]|nr:SOS response-associated peptidase [bacterium]
MCGHFAMDYAALIGLFHEYVLDGEDATPPVRDAWPPAGEFYPSRGARHTVAPVLLNREGRRRFENFRWDLVPDWWDGPVSEKKFASFNARGETIAGRAAFRGPWRKRQRCLVPATAFYEWPDRKGMPPGMRRREHRIALADTPVFWMAGIWDACPDRETRSTLHSFALITTAANKAVAEIPHTRMPVILKKEDETAWLDAHVPPEEAAHMLCPYPENQMIIETPG